MPSSCDATDPAGGLIEETVQAVPFQVPDTALAITGPVGAVAHRHAPGRGGTRDGVQLGGIERGRPGRGHERPRRAIPLLHQGVEDGRARAGWPRRRRRTRVRRTRHQRAGSSNANMGDGAAGDAPRRAVPLLDQGDSLHAHDRGGLVADCHAERRRRAGDRRRSACSCPRNVGGGSEPSVHVFGVTRAGGVGMVLVVWVVAGLAVAAAEAATSETSAAMPVPAVTTPAMRTASVRRMRPLLDDDRDR